MRFSNNNLNHKGSLTVTTSLTPSISEVAVATNPIMVSEAILSETKTKKMILMPVPAGPTWALLVNKNLSTPLILHPLKVWK